MRFMRKYAEFVGYTLSHSERIDEWRCPNKKCGMGIMEEYTCCPYCGQKIKFGKALNGNMIEINIKVTKTKLDVIWAKWKTVIRNEVRL